MRRIGIIGGTFNPIHIGHLAIAEVALEQLELDKMIFVPSYLPPHKSSKAVIDSLDRYRMVARAIKGHQKFFISDYEIKGKGKSYSIETAKYLRGLYSKSTKLYFIIGSDMVPSLGKWKQIQDLVKLVSFVVVSRRGYKNRRSPYKLKYISTLDLGISSSYLRRRIKGGKTIKYLLPENVHAYIKRRQLYQNNGKK